MLSRHCEERSNRRKLQKHKRCFTSANTNSKSWVVCHTLSLARGWKAHGRSLSVGPLIGWAQSDVWLAQWQVRRRVGWCITEGGGSPRRDDTEIRVAEGKESRKTPVLVRGVHFTGCPLDLMIPSLGCRVPSPGCLALQAVIVMIQFSF